MSPLCSPRTPVRAADLTVEGSGGIWILDSNGTRIFKLNKNCEVQKSFDSKSPALAIQVNTAGELVVLTSSGEALFDLYDQNGTLLRSFGRRISYGNPISDGELSNGNLAADRTGGFYFSFNYPPLVHHYGRNSQLLGEFKPPAGGRLRIHVRVSDLELIPPQKTLLCLEHDDRHRMLRKRDNEATAAR